MYDIYVLPIAKLRAEHASVQGLLGTSAIVPVVGDDEPPVGVVGVRGHEVGGLLQGGADPPRVGGKVVHPAVLWRECMYVYIHMRRVKF